MHDDLLAPLSGHQRTFAVLTAAGSPMLMADDVSQAADVHVSEDDDIAPVATIPSVGTAARNASLTAEAQTARAAIPSLAIDRDPIDKHGSIMADGTRAG